MPATSSPTCAFRQRGRRGEAPSRPNNPVTLTYAALRCTTASAPARRQSMQRITRRLRLRKGAPPAPKVQYRNQGAPRCASEALSEAPEGPADACARHCANSTALAMHIARPSANSSAAHRRSSDRAAAPQPPAIGAAEARRWRNGAKTARAGWEGASAGGRLPRVRRTYGNAEHARGGALTSKRLR